MRTFDWELEEVMTAHPGLYLEHCVVMAVAVLGRSTRLAAGFLVACEGFSPAALRGQREFRARVRWTEQTALKAERIRQTEQPKPIVERAAVALAALAIGNLLPGGQMRVTREGDRADYWLPGLRCALEVSGTTRAGELGRRHRQKASQVLSNPLGWNGYAFVVGFTGPQSRIRWSYHVQETSEHGEQE
jgi:hypothetical protein